MAISFFTDSVDLSIYEGFSLAVKNGLKEQIENDPDFSLIRTRIKTIQITLETLKNSKKGSPKHVMLAGADCSHIRNT